jgi:hypothetical protein
MKKFAWERKRNKKEAKKVVIILYKISENNLKVGVRAEGLQQSNHQQLLESL